MASPLPKFSFSGWTSQSLAPKVNPATAPPIVPPGLVLPPGLRQPGTTRATQPGQLVAQTNAANTDLPAWLQAEVDKLNAQQALRTQLTGQVTGQQPTQNVGDLMQGAAAQTRAAALFNAQVNQMNQQANLQNLVDRRARMNQPTGAFEFNIPFQVVDQLNLDRQINDFQRFNLPAASGWVGGGRPGTIWANGLLNGTGFA